MRTLFEIEPMEALPDCFRAPRPSAVFTPQNGLVAGWPSFHASPADPDGGYREHAYSVDFHLEAARDCELYLKIYASTPRLPWLLITINGQEGHWYFDPVPSRDAVIRPAHALHASIYSVDEARVFLPRRLFSPGMNRLTLTAMDEEPAEKVTNPQAVLRLDRMASACGFHYSILRLSEAEGPAPAPACRPRPGVVYLEGEGGLAEEVELVYELPQKPEGTLPRLQLAWAEGKLALEGQAAGRLFGQDRLSFLLPDGTGPVNYTFSGPFTAGGSFERRRKWLVYITPHAHTDIGYTHRQSEVAERMSRNIDTALEVLGGKDREAFSYILDSSWALEDHAQTRGQEASDRVVEEARAGKIGIPANYVDLLTQFASLEELIQNGAFSERLLRPKGLKADRMDIVDVASASWSLPSILAGMGVKYLLHANNQDRGPFRLQSGLHRKSPFFWQGPDGQQVLTWLARMYCEFKKVCGSPGSFPAAQRGLGMWLKEYERPDYQPDAVLLYGQEADNTDLDIRMAAFAGDWNSQVAYPRLVPSNGSSFFEHLARWESSFPRLSGDQGAYWEDGAASSPIASFEARAAQALLKSAQTLDSLAAAHEGKGAWPLEQYAQAWRWLLLYAEHTWGSFLSGMDPDSLLQKAQWETKANMARQARLCAESLMTRAASRLSLRWDNQGRELVVYNPASFPVSGIVHTEFHPEETVCDARGQELAWEELGGTGTLMGARVRIPEMPGLSYLRLPLVPREDAHRGGRRSLRAVSGLVSLENEAYTVVVDTAEARMISWKDKALGRELCGKGLGGLLHTVGVKQSTLTGNHAKYPVIPPREFPGFRVDSAQIIESALGQAVELRGAGGFGTALARFFLPKGEKRLELQYEVGLDIQSSPEALYVDFDLAFNGRPKVSSDSQTAWVDWQDNPMPGACREWLPLQTSILVEEEGQAVQIASPQAFLFTVGQPVSGLWRSDLDLNSPRVLSYVFNNHWQTNYLFGEKGRLCFQYSLASGEGITKEAAHQFGWAQRQGLFVQRMSYQEFRGPQEAPFDAGDGGVLMEAGCDHISLSTLLGSETVPGALVCRLQEHGGIEGTARVRLKGLQAWQAIDHLQRPLGPAQPCENGQLEARLTPWQVRSLLLYLDSTPEQA